MKELEYPFDADWILSNRKKIRKALINTDRTFLEKRIAVLGGSTSSNIIQVLDLFLLNHGIKAMFYESEYGKYYEDAMFPNLELEEFHPDIIYIFTTNRNITQYPSISDSITKINDLFSEEIVKFRGMWKCLTDKYSCPIIQNNFEMPMYRLLGNKDASDIHGAVNFISRMNLEFYNYAQEHKEFFICDINYISADYGLKKWCDPFYWYMYKYALNVSAIPSLSFNVANIIKSIYGRNKKGFVIDLDNTLWGGVVGDDGVENLNLGPETTTGQVFLDFQKYIKAHKNLGLLLNINSKNDLENAMAGLAHPDGVLRPEDFIEVKANWNSKDKNFQDIAEALNLLPESLVFLDDNPAERHIVSLQIPGVSAPELGDSHQYIINIDRNGFFEMSYLSEDDLKRNEMYQENVKRANALVTFTDYGEYLDSLEMKARIKPFDSMNISRIVQLTNKSNQFNLTTKRYTQGEIEELLSQKEYLTLYGKLEDKFGDNGIVALCIGHVVAKICHIDLWLMSCRVLKRDMECAMLDALVHRCQAIGISEIRAYYYPTAKNSMVKNFYRDMGFSLILEEKQGSVWKLDILPSYNLRNKHIQVEETE